MSSYGRVKSSRGVIGRGCKTGAYLSVSIAKHNYYVHRLVAGAFLEAPPPPGPWQVNHIDGDCTNNRAENLQYVSPAENVLHSYKTSPNRARPGKAVLWRRIGDRSWNLFASRIEASQALGVSCGAISRACKGAAFGVCGDTTPHEVKCVSLEEPPILEDEIWRDAEAPGEPSIGPDVMVSNQGRVFRSSLRRAYISYGTRKNNGYYSVQKGGRSYLVHRLVAATFLGQPELETLQVHHRDGDPGNNRACNLEYVTASENVKHAYESMTPGLRKGGVVGKAVCARLLGQDSAWRRFASIAAASLHTGVSWQNVSRICQGAQEAGPAWDFKFAVEEDLPGEEWRPVVLAGARTPRAKSSDERGNNLQ